MSGLGKEAANTFGVQIQHDQISNGLLSSRQRQRNSDGSCFLDQCRRDRIAQSSIGIYAENHVHWNDWFRTVAGLRGDYFRFANTSLETSLAGVNNTATVNDFITSPKLNLVFGPWSKTEYYYSIGNGYHSNDARGVTIGGGARRADGLVRTFGQEVGVRTEIIAGLQTTFAVFQLDNASEIVYIGDAGLTEDSGRRSRRTGFEFNNYFKANSWLTIDADYALARARFRDPVAGEGDYIPGAVEGVASVAAIVDDGGTYSGSLQLRHFGPRPLTDKNDIRSDGTTTLNGRVSYRVNNDTRLELVGFNLLNSQHSAIDYYNDSYTFDHNGRNLGSGLSGRVFHPVEPINFRVVLITRY
jgi:hypothetical protein